MTDIELVEMAAKAAGIKYDQESAKPHPKSDMWFGLWLLFDREPSEYDRRYWNPLADDGDALRLAVKLGMVVYIDTHPEGRKCTEAKSETFAEGGIAIFNHGSDPYAATRRAIVLAAANIGKEAS